jgi:hypothetical protein
MQYLRHASYNLTSTYGFEVPRKVQANNSIPDSISTPIKNTEYDMTSETPESVISINPALTPIQSTVSERECTVCRRRREAQRISRGDQPKPTGVTKKKMPPRMNYVSTYLLESQSGTVTAPRLIVTDPSSPLSFATAETDVSLVNIPPTPYYLSHIMTPLLEPSLELRVVNKQSNQNFQVNLN